MHIYLYMKGIYWDDFQVSVQLILTMAHCEEQIQESNSCSVPQGWVSQMVLCICWNPEEVGSSASERVDVLVKQGQVGKEQNLPSSMSFYRLPAEGVAQIKGLSSFFKV